ncbi:hypothetical protein KKC45_03375 [Patescibacteria group bacterium]|nr:hypothetical protein [Patescibacteria group bacterium]
MNWVIASFQVLSCSLSLMIFIFAIYIQTTIIRDINNRTDEYLRALWVKIFRSVKGSLSCDDIDKKVAISMDPNLESLARRASKKNYEKMLSFLSYTSKSLKNSGVSVTDKRFLALSQVQSSLDDFLGVRQTKPSLRDYFQYYEYLKMFFDNSLRAIDELEKAFFDFQESKIEIKLRKDLIISKEE